MSGRHGRIEGARVHFRLPPDLKRWLEDRAAGRVRTMASELVTILEKTRSDERAKRTAARKSLVLQHASAKRTDADIGSPNLANQTSAPLSHAEIDFGEAIQHLSREKLIALADDQCSKLCLMWENVLELLALNLDDRRVYEIAQDMAETLNDNSVEHEMFYGGKARERLLSLFPALREGGAV
ncbi:hypothetical protein [Komagataeibacter sp. FXV3]|uniref:hypothetical protein n=1 Tax=Komagataeibacter sp. FXV3 TaxID=2608998 RepID=UPI00187B4067|nr:hypothetical protein [Komagataeibacter sp. FXV3]MBE7729437.1 hypothetical protein [Komagataeibacter sp. FXV3]